MKKIGMSLALVVGFVGLSSAQVACTVQTNQDPAEGVAAPKADEPAQPGASQPSNPGQPATSDDPMAMPPRPSAGMAMVRAIHASADAPTVDAYVKGSDKPIVTNLSYGQTSGWIEVPKGTYEIELRAAPSKPTDPIAYKTAKLEIPEGAMISAIAAGLLGSAEADSTFRLVPLVESFEVAKPGTVKVRALHAGADAPSVDLDVGNDDPSAPEVGDLERFQATPAAGVALPSNQPLAIGIAKNQGRVTAFTTPKLPDGANLLVIATGLLAKLPREKDGFALLAIGPSGSVGFIKQDPIVYALHAGPDAPAVDAFVGDAEIVSNISFGQISAPIQVQPGSYTLDFYAATAGNMRPAGNPAASAMTPKLDAGERYLAAATGFLGNGSFTLLGAREGFDMDDTKSILRAVHGSPDAPAVDIGLVSAGKLSPVLFGDLTFRTSSVDRGLAADPAHLFVGVAAAGTGTPVKTFTVPATAGKRSFVVAAGALAPAAGQKSFRLLAVDTAQTPWTVATVLPH